MNESLLYFAYGSNMLKARIRQRVPSATVRGIAELPGYRLAWHKKSQDGSGKCDIVAEPGASVFGAVYEIPGAEKAKLDSAEGLGAGYNEKTITVRMDGANLDVLVYYATSINGALQPYSWYKSLVLAGAKENCLPLEYIAALERAPSIQDGDSTRHDKNIHLVYGG